MLHKTLTIPSISFVSLIFSYHISCLISCINYYNRRKLDWPMASIEARKKPTQRGWEDNFFLFVSFWKKMKIGRFWAKIDWHYSFISMKTSACVRTLSSQKKRQKNDDQIHNLLKYEFKIYVDTRLHWNFKWNNLTATFLAHFKRFFFNCLCCSDL